MTTNLTSGRGSKCCCNIADSHVIAMLNGKGVWSKRSMPMGRRTVQFITILVLSLAFEATEGFVRNFGRTTNHAAQFAPAPSEARFKIQREISTTVTSSDRSKATTLFYHDENEDERRRIELTNSFLKASRTSFKNFEGATDSLLDKNPLIAFGIFIGLGLLVAYISGFAILDGYIDSTNPLDNAAVPYWNEDLSTPEP